MNSSYCEKYSGLIEDLIEGELDDELAAEQINSHVFACPQCQKLYETLKREKEIYAHYLFDAEPPTDLWQNFQARLISEKEKSQGSTVNVSAISSWQRTANIFGFLRLSPTLTAVCATLLFTCGVGFFWLKIAPAVNESDKQIAETDAKNSRLSPNFDEIEGKSPENLQPKTTDNGNNMAQKNSETFTKEQSLKVKNNFSVGRRKSFAAETVKIKLNPVAASERKKAAGEIRPISETERRLGLRRRMQNLEKEIAGQIEKVELLLRSFRNARTMANPEIFDVEYEKTQARKLLEKNARLRRDAENYGIFYAEELLSRVEPYLLDIANLETNPAPGKVLDIKERVSNQNIIASLQVYSSAATAQ